MERTRGRSSCVNAVVGLVVLGVGLWQPWKLLAQAPVPAKGVKYAQVSQAELKEWLTYLASDQLQGRQLFSEGYGLASAKATASTRSWSIVWPTSASWSAVMMPRSSRYCSKPSSGS